MKLITLILFAILSLSIVQACVAEDIVNEATQSCINRNILPLTKCPEYNAAMKQAQQIAGSAVNDPTIKAENKAAIDKAVAAAGITNN